MLDRLAIDSADLSSKPLSAACKIESVRQLELVNVKLEVYTLPQSINWSDWSCLNLRDTNADKA
ncbi:MAG: hypothetical protein R3C53_11000 [Pirellulaceae bacterium]